ncbi:MAG: ABC transporter ATP-binding protein [Lachnospiraceae bacterium]|nr:ABC transporter ATP-binding protein [Lachnospiraceae bacterium]
MVELIDICKTIKKRSILDHINYQFENGKIYGLYGPNGSGKTMILRVLAGLVVPDSGRVLIHGRELHKEISFPPSVGLIIEHMELLPAYNAEENLQLLARISKKADEEDIRKILKDVGLETKIPVKKYSLGMKQRLNIAQAIFEKPELILLDEPGNALDEAGIKTFHQLMNREKERGACIIIATHSKSDLVNICDEVLLVENGKLKQGGIQTGERMDY